MPLTDVMIVAMVISFHSQWHRFLLDVQPVIQWREAMGVAVMVSDGEATCVVTSQRDGELYLSPFGCVNVINLVWIVHLSLSLLHT